MRIFTAVRHALDRRFFHGALWSSNFYPALRQLGCELVESQIDLYPLSRFMNVPGDYTPEELNRRAQLTEQILREVREAHQVAPLDLFLGYFYNAHFDPAGFNELRAMGVPSVNFFCNSTHQFPLVASIAANAEFSWHPEKNARRFYVGAGGNPVWVQFGADPSICRPIPDVTRVPSACFIGSRYADREWWLGDLVRHDVPVCIFGSGWQGGAEDRGANPSVEVHLGRRYYRAGSFGSYGRAFRDALQSEGPISGCGRIWRQLNQRRQRRGLLHVLRPFCKGPALDISFTFARFELCVNFSNVWADGRPGARLIPHVRLRDFEGPMCRASYITGHTDEIGEFYEIGKEIETYRTAEELVDKSQFYLAHPDAAEKLRDAGYRRSRAEHCWVNRFRELFGKIGLKSGDHKLV